ncbi:ferredoxin reductase [Chelatococcus reniformis]|uniref:Ferredoxin reductase n=1 Tax=Chelatococcus reniformis TaxID=1494448 RepID=A0A916U9U5_9HYPH|nr:ferredoxin reductase [Chelatococcus reniformis]
MIVGAGQAGGRAAEALRAAGHRGPLTLLGEERHPPYERPQLSKAILLDDVAAPAFMRPDADWPALGIDLVVGAAAVDGDLGQRRVGLADGREYAFDKLLIATGTRPRRLEPLEEGPLPVLYLRDLDDALVLRCALAPGRRVVLIGGGVIGLEVAAAAVGRGCTVTVVEAAPRLMPHVGSASLSRFMDELHRDRGVAIRCGVTAMGQTSGGVDLSDGSSVAADIVLIGVGVEPALGLARALGLGDGQGIGVDATGATAADGIYAAGDVALQWSRCHGRALRLENWANAQNQAIATARTMAGEAMSYDVPSWFWSDQFDANVQVVGDPGAGEEFVRGDPASGRFAVLSLAGDEIVGGITVNGARDMAVLRRLVAAGKRIALSDWQNPAYDLRQSLKA